jgi:SAM-dependent methyltransferase
MTESPDLPWAKDHDGRLKKEFDIPPSRSVVFFFEFLKGKGLTRGRVIDIGCGNGRNAIFFARNGFEVHAVDKSDEVLKDMDLHGVMPHCHSVTDCWLFEDGFFDAAIDVFCYSEQEDEGRKGIYRSELVRVLKEGGYYLLSLPAGRFTRERAASEFDGLEVVAAEESTDEVRGKKERSLNLILRKK